MVKKKKQFTLPWSRLSLELILIKDRVYYCMQAVTHISVTSEIDIDVTAAAELSSACLVTRRWK